MSACCICVHTQINGRPLVAAEGTERLAAAAVTADGRFLLTGGAKGSVRLRWLHSLQVAFIPVICSSVTVKPAASMLMCVRGFHCKVAL